MQRAKFLFEKAGLSDAPTPADFQSHAKELNILDFLQSAIDLDGSEFAIKDLIGHIHDLSIQQD